MSPTSYPEPQPLPEEGTPFWDWVVTVSLKKPREDMIFGKRLELFMHLLQLNTDLAILDCTVDGSALTLTAGARGDINDAKLDVWQAFMAALNQLWPEYSKMTKQWDVRASARKVGE